MHECSAPERLELLSSEERLSPTDFAASASKGVLLDVRPQLQFDAAHFTGTFPFYSSLPSLFSFLTSSRESLAAASTVLISWRLKKSGADPSLFSLDMSRPHM